MKFRWNYIKLILLLCLITVLYSFSNARNRSRTIQDIKIEFSENENLYLTYESVNKLLIQNYGDLRNVPKENLVLNTVEKVVAANEMVKSAQVYLTVNGDLTAKIVQRQPIGRVEGNRKFYLDDEGKRMPFSKYHSARVPIITGLIDDESLADVYALLQYVNADDFLKKNVIGIQVKDHGQYQLKFRLENFVVNLGGVEDLQKKFNNFKAFYAKASKDKTLDKYNIVSLEFNNQVVCTKI